jgi:SPP1 gp7 family putative phage head morphogenesis protein
MRVKTLRDLYERTYQNLRGITDDMADIIRTELTEGFAAGENPRKIADRLTDKVSNLQKTRAETLARTEVINAHSEATLDEYENAGVDVVGHGDWQATQDTRTCPFCRRISGERFTLDELRGDTAVEFRGQVYRLSPPSHPNGRCAILPAVGFDGDLPPLSERVPGEIVS